MTQAARFSWHAALAGINRLGWLGEPPVGSSPWLDPPALARWRQAIAGTEVYLEYGSGGSTVEAVSSAAHVVAVDTDRAFLSATGDVPSRRRGAGRLHMVHVDIGVTGKWGRPILLDPSKPRLARWRRYPSAPWDLLSTLGLTPGFILVDGRFRVASVLESFLRLPDQADCLLMLDDFHKRPRHYEPVLKFASDVETVGRALTFRRAARFDRAECARLLKIYQADPE